MPIDYNLFYQTLEDKVQQGLEELSKLDVADRDYQMILSNIVTTANLVKNFADVVPANMGGTPTGIKVGDKYESYSGDTVQDKIVIFTSEGCSYCKAMKPVYLPALREAGVYVEDINISEEKAGEFSRELGITGVPAYLIVKDGVVTHRFEGFDTAKTSKENVKDLMTLLEKHLF